MAGISVSHTEVCDAITVKPRAYASGAMIYFGTSCTVILSPEEFLSLQQAIAAFISESKNVETSTSVR